MRIEDRIHWVSLSRCSNLCFDIRKAIVRSKFHDHAQRVCPSSYPFAVDPDRDRPRVRKGGGRCKTSDVSPLLSLVRHLARRDHGVSMGASVSARHDTGQSREITWREVDKGRSGGEKRRNSGSKERQRRREGDDDGVEREERVERGLDGGQGREETQEEEREERKERCGGEEGEGEKKKRGEKRMVRVPRGEVLGLACPGMASSHSRAFAVRGHHRARATLGFSTFSPRCLPTLRSKTASLKTFANSERATNQERDELRRISPGEGTVRDTRPKPDFRRFFDHLLYFPTLVRLFWFFFFLSFCIFLVFRLCTSPLRSLGISTIFLSKLTKECINILLRLIQLHHW